MPEPKSTPVSDHPSTPVLSPTSSTSISIASYSHPLPSPSKKPLNPSASSSLIRYLDTALLSTSSLHLQRFSENGYRSISGLCVDLEKLVDVLWISSSAPLQIQYLLQIANTFNEYIWGYHVQGGEWKNVFALVDKLDRCFHSMITEGKVDMTEKVRLKSVIERTRLHLVKLPEFRGEEDEGPDRPIRSIEDACGRDTEVGAPITPATEEDGMEVEDDGDNDGDEDEDGIEVGDDDDEAEEDLEWEIEISKVYERTLQEIGDELASTTS
ncbi:hypothetical protein BDD12DRAFT_882376 [Trichophaea hybrida]|nr:hypothetical protein BDD12DRAFT_882376 [Trichophaea hybrida]